MLFLLDLNRYGTDDLLNDDKCHHGLERFPDKQHRVGTYRAK